MKFISADYIKARMKNDRLMQGNAEYELWKQEVDKQVDAMPSIEVMDVITAYQQGWCDALDASISALNDAKFQIGKADSTADTPQTEELPFAKLKAKAKKPFRAVWVDDEYNELGEIKQTDCPWK